MSVSDPFRGCDARVAVDRRSKDDATRASQLQAGSHRAAFTLIELLVATVLAAVLMSAVLAMIAGVSRDRRLLTGSNSGKSGTGIVELLRWDLSNAASVATTQNGSLRLLGVAGVDPTTLSPNGRLVQVSYQLQADKSLWRVQEYLDDAARPETWRELVAANVTAFSVSPSAEELSPVPPRMRLRLATVDADLDQDLWIK